VFDEIGCGGEVNGVLLEELRFTISMGWSGGFVWGGDVDFRESIINGRFNLGCGAGAVAIRCTSFALGMFSNQ
jgi:hypothetical protein